MDAHSAFFARMPAAPHREWRGGHTGGTTTLRLQTAMTVWAISIAIGYAVGALAIAPAEMDAHCWGTAALLAHASLSNGTAFDLFVFAGVMCCHRILMATGAASWRGICERRK